LEVKRFEREKNSATSKSKCESSLTTVIDSGVFATIGTTSIVFLIDDLFYNVSFLLGDEFRGILEATFAVKSIGQQLKEESQIVPNSVVWRRRIIDGRLVDRPGTSEQVLERCDYEVCRAILFTLLKRVLSSSCKLCRHCQHNHSDRR
jgi:hypothetical protein